MKEDSIQKQQITINIDKSAIKHFKDLAKESGIKYQHLINMYLNHCSKNNIKPKINWEGTE